MNKIGVVVAMDNEYQAIKEVFKTIDEVVKDLFISYLNNNIYIVHLSGIGKVNASMGALHLINNYHVSSLVSVGFCGGASKNINFLDVIIPKTASYYDFNLVNFGYKLGQVPGYPQSFKCHELGYNKGHILTADSFLNIKVKEDNVIVDMESASIGQVAYKYKIPFIALKVVSDNGKVKDYQKNTNESLRVLKDAFNDFIKNIKKQKEKENA